MHDKITGAALPSVSALAYIGDARHSLYVREMLVKRGISKSGELNRLALDYVTAEAQVVAFKKIEPYLTEDELDTFKRAANSKHLNRPTHATVYEYRTATGFEAVIGMLHLIRDDERIAFLMEKAYAEDEK